MSDRATPNLPSRDFAATSHFYSRLGFTEQFRDQGWMILVRGSIQIEFFPYADLDPYTNSAGCCIRVSDARQLYDSFSSAGLPIRNKGIPRITAPVDRPWGFTEFAVLDLDGNLLRCLSPLSAGKA